jgi:integrase
MARPKRQAPWLGRRDDNGTFYAHWYNDATRRVDRLSLRTTDPEEAQNRFAEFLLNGRELRNTRPRGEITVTRALDDYLEEHVRPNCAAAKRQQEAITHLKAFFGDRPLSEVDVPASRMYTLARTTGAIGGGRRRKDKTAAPATVRRELNVLVAAANHAIWMKRATISVAVDMPPERRLGPDDEAPYYTQDELDRIFATATAMDAERRDAVDGDDIPRPDLEPFLRLLYQTAARRASIEDLTRGQVKRRERRIILQPAGKRTTKKRQPIVPILKAMEPALEYLLNDNARDRLFEFADYYRLYKRCCARAGIEEGRRHPHIMRHTRATHLLQEGKSLYDVAKLLGDTVATIERVYGHHSHEHLASRLED